MSIDDDEMLLTKTKSEDFFYSQIPYEVWTCKSLPDPAIRLYAAYHSFCKIKKIILGESMTFVSQYRLADLLGWDVRKVKRQQKILEDEGFIRVKKGGFNKANKIYLNNIMPRKKPDYDQDTSNDDLEMVAKNANESQISEDTSVTLNR